MKILGNIKDYYDYLQGTYGIDPKVVYERICMTLVGDKWVKQGIYKPEYLNPPADPSPYYEKPSSVYFYVLAICGKLYCVFIHNRKFYFPDHTDALEKLESRVDKVSRQYMRNRYSDSALHLRKTDVNEKENCPVCLIDTNSYHRGALGAMVKNVRLSDFGIGQIISPNDMYIMISNFLSREKVVIDNRTDVQKIVSKGFDKKTSFRKTK